MLRRTIELAIVALIVTNVLELVFVFKLRNDARLYDSNVRFPLPSGYFIDKGLMDTDARCYLVRLASDSCPYCRLDQGLYIALVQRARQATCKTIILAPKVGQIQSGDDGGGGATLLQFVNMKFGRALNPFITPQTFLVDRKGSILWDREGAMDKRALLNALQSLEKVR